MKLYKKSKLVALRVNDFMDQRLKGISEYLELDRSDMIRMFISNALKYWEGEKTRNNLIKKYEAHDHSYTNQDLEYIANKETKIQLAQNQMLSKQTEQPKKPTLSKKQVQK